jgi:hypothetical protein
MQRLEASWDVKPALSFLGVAVPIGLASTCDHMARLKVRSMRGAG